MFQKNKKNTQNPSNLPFQSPDLQEAKVQKVFLKKKKMKGTLIIIFLNKKDEKTE
jgi:hypothetical protein